MKKSRAPKQIRKATPATPEQELNQLRPEIDEKALAKIMKDKPKSARARKALRIFEPQVHEETKSLLLTQGMRCSALGQTILKQLALVRKPYVVNLGREKQSRLQDPHKDPSDFEFLGKKHKCPLYCMISTTKSRPLRMFAGRLFDWKLYDMLEFDIVGFQPMRTGNGAIIPVEGSKPIMLFQGALWDQSPELLQAKNCLADIFGGIKAKNVILENIDRAITCTIYDRVAPISEHIETVIEVCHWTVGLYKDLSAPAGPGNALPKVSLHYLGPKLLLKPGFTRLPDQDAVKAALKIPAEEFAKGKSSVKTVTNDLRETRQQVHVDQESLKTVNLRHGH